MLMKYFLDTALKPYQDIFEILENLMRMEKIMDSKNEHWDFYNDNIPNWFYKMIIICLYTHLTLPTNREV